MDYEALGRYIEAMENLPKLGNELQNCLRTIEQQARAARDEIDRLTGFANNPDPVRVADKLQTAAGALARAQTLHQDILAHAHTVNTQAERCGRRSIAIRHD